MHLIPSQKQTQNGFASHPPRLLQLAKLKYYRFALAAGILLFAACAKHDIVPPPPLSLPQSTLKPAHPVGNPAPALRMIAFKSDAKIRQIMDALRSGDLSLDQAKSMLTTLQQTGSISAMAPSGDRYASVEVSAMDTALADEAHFRLVQLELEFHDPYAEHDAFTLLMAKPDHLLVPDLHYWIAQEMLSQQRPVPAREQLLQALSEPYATIQLGHRVLQAGIISLMQEPEDVVAVRWLWAAASRLRSTEDINLALESAAPRVPLAMLAHIRQSLGNGERHLLALLYQTVARLALMRGQPEVLRQLATWAEQDLPGTDAAQLIRQWRNGGAHSVVIGVLLPLSGRYAAFGQQALHGIRLAISKLPYGDHISLVIADAQGGALAAYNRLLSEGSVVVIGPLLAETVQRIAPHLRSTVPLLALTNQSDLASLSPALFIHSAGPQFQALFLADHLLQQWALAGASKPDLSQSPATMKVAILASNAASSQAAAASFTQTLRRYGVDDLHQITIDGGVDERRTLMALRQETDDGILLNRLNEDLALLIAEPALTPQLPPDLDAIYLPIRGAQISRLAGQLAYVGLNQVPLLGDSGWLDGHLLDDHGRYLAKARIATVMSEQSGGVTHRLIHATDADYRQLWGESHQSLLSAVAFDSLMIGGTLTSSWGLQGRPLIHALHDAAGFPLASGRVVFDLDGVGHKQFALQTVRHGHVVILDAER